jgi:hypothetical protein
VFSNKEWVDLYRNGTVAEWIGRVEQVFVEIGRSTGSWNQRGSSTRRSISKRSRKPSSRWWRPAVISRRWISFLL